MQLPSIDQNICGSWTQQQTDLYNKLPFYLMEAEADYRKHWTVYNKLLNPIAWKPNMGDTMRRILAEPAPIMRQEAYPVTLDTKPKTDVINYRERKADAKPRWHDFVSPHFSFLPEFQDFMKHIDENMENINRQVTIFEDIFYRTMLFHHAPYVYVVGVGLVEAPVGDPASDGSSGKTDAWIQAQITSLSGVQAIGLPFVELFKALNVFEQDIGASPFEGTGTPKGDSAPLNEKYCLVHSPESWNNFVDDPWLKENRPINMNIVTDAFRGEIFGKVRCRQERFPIRYAIDEDFAPTRHNPEVIEENPDRPDFGRTKPNTLYSRVKNSPIEVAFLLGGNAADYIQTGPPPSEYTKDLDQGAAVKMNWNGKSYMTKEFLVPCKDENGTTVYEANSFGRYLRIQASLSLGISMINMHNVLPIIFKRKATVSVTGP